MKKQTVVLALIIVALAAVVGMATTTIQQSMQSSVAQAKNGTGCAPGSTGFIHSHGKCFHPENLLKGNKTKD